MVMEWFFFVKIAKKLMKKRYIIFISFFFILAACKKEEVDFNKYDNYKPEPEFGLPLVNADLKLVNLVKSDSNIRYDADGFMRLFFRKSKIKEVNTLSLLTIPNQGVSSYTQKLGLLDIADFNIEGGRSLTQMRNGFQNQTTKDAIDLAIANSPTIVPALSDGAPNITPFSLFNSFTQAKIASGYLKVKFDNKLTVTVSSMTVNIYDIAFLPATLVGTLSFTNVAPGASQTDSFNMAGKTLSNELGFNISQFLTLASATPVAISGSDSLLFKASTSNLKVRGGRTILEEQNVQSEDLFVDLTPDDPSTLIRKVGFTTASINYSYVSSLSEDIELSLNFIGAKRSNGQALPAQTVYLSANSNSNGAIVLNNTIMDFTQDPLLPYNRLRVLVVGRLMSSGQLVTFDSSDAINLLFSFSNIKFNYVEGFFGTRTIPIDQGDVNLAELKKLQGSLNFENPEMNFITYNSMGIPMEANLDLDGESAAGLKEKFNGPKLTVDFPKLNEIGQTKTSIGTFNTSNSNIRKVMALPPLKFNYIGSVITNVGLPSSTNNFLTDSSKVSFDIETKIPMSFSTAGFGLIDSFKNEATTGDGMKNVLKAELVLRITNGFPLGGDFTLYFVDTTGTRLDSVTLINALVAAPIDASGKVTQVAAQTISRINLAGNLLENVKKSVKIYVLPSFKTSGGTDKYVKIYSDYNINVKVGMNVKIRY